MAVAKMLGWLPITSSTSQPRLSPKLKGRCLILLPELNALLWVLILGRSFYLHLFCANNNDYDALRLNTE